MARPFSSRRSKGASVDVAQIENLAITKAMSAVMKAAVDDPNFKKSFLSGNAAKMPGTTWSNQGTINNALIARVSQNLSESFGRAPQELELALSEQGLSWGPPFTPGRPLDAFWGYRRPPRTWDFSVGENVQLVPRWNRTSFQTLKAIIESYDVAQVCIRHLINDVRSLDYQFVPPANVAEDATEDIEAAEKFFRYPDRRQPFRAWLAEYLQDVLRYDAGCLYIRRNEGGDPIALEVVSGTTIIPLIDFFGRIAADEDDLGPVADKIAELGGTWDGSVVPSYLQIIMGMPWVWLAADDIIYQPWNPLPDSQYGLAPMEATLLMANTSVRYQWFILQYFTEGTIPAGFMEAPPDLTDINQVNEWQEVWDAFMEGDQAKLRQMRWVPAGSKFTAVKPFVFDKDFPLYFDYRTMASFGVTPNDLGWTQDVNRSTGDTQIDVQFRVGTLPLVRHVEDLINAFISERLHLKARLQFDVGREIEDRLVAAQAEDLRIRNGTISSDEARIRLGLRISRERPTPRIIDNNRAGPIPLLGLDSMGGKIDPTTYGPAKDQQLIDHPFVSVPGVAPVIGSSEFAQAQNATVAMQRNMFIQNDDPKAPGQEKTGSDVKTEPVVPAPVPPKAQPQTLDVSQASTDSAEKAQLEEALVLIDRLVSYIEKDGGSIDNTGGPGVTRGFSNPTTVTGGITVDTDLQGIDLDHGTTIDDDKDEIAKKLRQWRDNSANRIRKGSTPRKFIDVPSVIADPLWKRLEGAKSVSEVNAAFAELGKVLAPKGALQEPRV